MAKGEGRMTESEGKGPEGKGPGAASRLPDIMLCSAGGGGGGGREVDLDRKLLEQQLPDVMLCSWTASVLMDRRRERCVGRVCVCVCVSQYNVIGSMFVFILFLYCQRFIFFALLIFVLYSLDIGKEGIVY